MIDFGEFYNSTLKSTILSTCLKIIKDTLAIYHTLIIINSFRYSNYQICLTVRSSLDNLHHASSHVTQVKKFQNSRKSMTRIFRVLILLILAITLTAVHRWSKWPWIFDLTLTGSINWLEDCVRNNQPKKRVQLDGSNRWNSNIN